MPVNNTVLNLKYPTPEDRDIRINSKSTTAQKSEESLGQITMQRPFKLDDEK